MPVQNLGTLVDAKLPLKMNRSMIEMPQSKKLR
jgi:hypothetical protein